LQRVESLERWFGNERLPRELSRRLSRLRPKSARDDASVAELAERTEQLEAYGQELLMAHQLGTAIHTRSGPRWFIAAASLTLALVALALMSMPRSQPALETAMTVALQQHALPCRTGRCTGKPNSVPVYGRHLCTDRCWDRPIADFLGWDPCRLACATEGRCHFGELGCVALSDDHCAAADVCLGQQRCIAVDGACKRR
jgi:hypothetical protein